ncbi:hypothetical protein FJV83_03375 [Mesorhizobium sp. WSM4307]|uniref:rhamnosyltransferase WsaF family glycosyltransferase n=1 Tax=unclassified Mesorhizobium TaxID=325217 RepID=UPI00115E9B38|nr:MULTISPECIES: hypothetical protein [unclassified Mesorhizobium]TRC79838.1 hypothetical protein FJV81_07270 [Mesorhizobium sp. WSM4315]TRC88716.1 hypothetical protein FJV83_03375 [Mesorhizobium sp. WSM4307]
MRRRLTATLAATGARLFGHQELKQSYHKVFDPNIKLRSYKSRLAYMCMSAAHSLGLLADLQSSYLAQLPLVPAAAPPNHIYDRDFLNLRLNRVYDLPEIEIDERRPQTINVLVPAFDFKSISAGFFGVFQMALFLRKTGVNVRLVMFDNFYFNLSEFKEKLLKYPGMERIFDELEVEYIGERRAPLRLSKYDYAVATVWYSAYFAEKIQAVTENEKFIYLIQDYETLFYPANSLHAVADRTYSMKYNAIFSSESLMNFFVLGDVGGIRSRGLSYTFFNNACSANLLPKDVFIQRNRAKKKKKIVFYSRPVVDRNMFELTALALATAFRRGIFDPEEWECVGMGLGEGVVELLPSVRSVSLPRMDLSTYIEEVSSFDICLTLMASPHPSMIPMDLAGSGSVVVTNTFKTKTEEYLKALSKNIIPAQPGLNEIVAALEVAKAKCLNLEDRYNFAKSMKYPRDWNQSLTPRHLSFFNRHLRVRVDQETRGRRVRAGTGTGRNLKAS